MTEQVEHIAGLVASCLQDLGLCLWGVEYRPGPGRALLRIYIDAVDRMVGIEDCERASREISALLDVHDPISGEYTLEVSSPGIDRPLFTLEQLSGYIGQSVKLALRVPQDGRRRVQGLLHAVCGQEVTLDLDGARLVLAWANVEKARLVPDLTALGLEPKAPTGRGTRKSRKQ